MALNLWKLAGKPTAYHPLPIGSSNYSDKIVFPSKEYVISFKAKSNHPNAVVRLSTFSSVPDLAENISIDSTLKHYEVRWFEKDGGQLFISDYNSVGDIIIQDIELVEKPLPKLTINGIDGFLSGKWSLHPNARVIDDETLELNATGNLQYSEIYVPVNPNTEYAVSLEVPQNARFYLYERDVNKNNIAQIGGTENGTSVRKIKTASNTYYLRVVMDNNVSSGTFIFKRPMLNLGTTPVPYSKKTGERMVMGVPVKNLWNESLWKHRDIIDGRNVIKFWGFPNANYDEPANSSHSPLIIKSGFKPYTQYTVSFKGKYTAYFNAVKVHYTDGTKGNYTSPTDFKPFSITTDIGKTVYAIAIETGGIAAMGYIEEETLMVQEGTVATPYEPYAVQVNKKPFNTNNLFDGTLVEGYFAPNSGHKVSSLYHLRTPNYIKAEAGCRIEIPSKNNFYVHWYDSNKEIIASKQYLNIAYADLYVDFNPNVAYVRFHFDRKPDSHLAIVRDNVNINPKAKSGLVMDGTQYVQLPSMTMDAIEIDCLIDEVQLNSTPYLLDTRSGGASSR